MRPDDRNTATATGTSGYYDRLWAQHGVELGYIDRSRAEFVVAALREIRRDGGLSILDLGCGRGWMAPFLSPFGSVTGIDFSPEGIRIAREAYGQHARFLLAQADAPMLGLPGDARFDVVVCSEVIEHVAEPAALLRQIAGLLHPGGWCLLTTPNGNVWTRFRSDPRFVDQLQPIENWLTTRGLAALLRQEGYRVVRHEGRPAFSFRVGPGGLVQRRSIERACKALGLGRAYWRAIRPTALYQVVVARKTGGSREAAATGRDRSP